VINSDQDKVASSQFVVTP